MTPICSIVAAVLGNLKAGLREAEVLELPPGAAIQQVPHTDQGCLNPEPCSTGYTLLATRSRAIRMTQ